MKFSLARVALASALLCAPFCAHAQTPISGLPAATSGNASDLYECSQGTGVAGHYISRKCTPSQIVAAGGGSSASNTVNAGTGLSGGGVISSNPTLSIVYGTTSGTAAQGNDSRITGALQASTAATTYAPLASPALTGSPTAPTQTVGDNSTKIATDAFVLANAASGGATSTAGDCTSTYASSVLTLTCPKANGTAFGTAAFQPTSAFDAAGAASAAQAASLQKSNNLSDLSNVATARTNLGLATVATSGSASDLSAGTLAPARGGLGASSLVGYIYGNGSGAATSSTSVPTSALSGTISATQGGLGAASLTGYLYGNGSSAATSSTTIPNTAITGLGTAATYAVGTSGATLGLLSTANTYSTTQTYSASPILPTPAYGDNSTKGDTTAFLARHSTCNMVDDNGGDPTGTNNNDTAFSSTVAAALRSGQLCVQFGPGLYKFASQVNYSLPSSLAGITVLGMGPEVTRLQWASSGGLELTFNSNTQSVHIRDLMVLAGTTNAGSGIYLNQSATVANPALGATSDVTHVGCRGADGYDVTNYWTNCVEAYGANNVNYYDVTGFGAGSNGVGLYVHGTSSNYAVAHNIKASNFSFMAKGVRYGDYTQGLTADAVNTTAVTYGFTADGTGAGTDQFAISNSQCAASVSCFYDAGGVANTTLTNNLFSSTTANALIYHWVKAANPSVTGNACEAYNTSGNVCFQVDATNTGYAPVFAGNTIIQASTGYKFASGTSNISVFGSVPGATTAYSSSGSNNTIVLGPNWTGALNIAGATAITGTESVSALASLNGSANVQGYVNIYPSGGGGNFVGLDGASSGGNPSVSAAGADTNINLQLGSKGTGEFVFISGSGTCGLNPPSTTLVCSSDRRLKSNIRAYSGALDYLDSFKVRDYTYNATGQKMVGVIAQEVKIDHPEMVHVGPHDAKLKIDPYMVDSMNSWVLVRAIQELRSQLAEQAAELNQIKRGALKAGLRRAKRIAISPLSRAPFERRHRRTPHSDHR